MRPCQRHKGGAGIERSSFSFFRASMVSSSRSPSRHHGFVFSLGAPASVIPACGRRLFRFFARRPSCHPGIPASRHLVVDGFVFSFGIQLWSALVIAASGMGRSSFWFLGSSVSFFGASGIAALMSPSKDKISTSFVFRASDFDGRKRGAGRRSNRGCRPLTPPISREH